ncbi:hypothetical protein TcasGA2_TC031315 [Tribolium castaneum]|uniref:Uncharacterized protein n=1 Tax=Tribolium castaneum TaxID=7070 RepID=A0A139WAK4_TRICA|nr:hypothetical protein TcasGA2_TC031315 [Tribolium castaneum]
MSLHEQTRKEFAELLEMKRKLTKYSTALNKEIMKTDVEWMNLSAIAKKLDKADENPPQNTVLKKKETALLEETVLNLNPNKNHQSGYEEFDSDSE